MGQELELLGPGQREVEVDVHFGQNAVKDQILELLLVADMAVDGARDDLQAGAQAAHGQGFDAVLSNDRQRFFDDAFAGELAATVLIIAGRVEPEGACPSVGCDRVGGSCRWRSGCGPLRFITLS
jgi:hypothetical protein